LEEKVSMMLGMGFEEVGILLQIFGCVYFLLVRNGYDVNLVEFQKL